MKKAVFFDFYGVLVNQGRVDSELIEILYELRAKGIKLFLISNADREQSQLQPREFPAIEVFDKRYYSWQTGFTKPDPRSYVHVLKEQNLQPEEVVYFDDHQLQVDAANALGIESYLYRDATQVRKKLEL